MIQGRFGDPSGQNSTGVWASPERDICICLPYIVRAALSGLNTELEKRPEEFQAKVTEFAGVLADFFKLCSGEHRPTGDNAKVKAFEISGMLQADQEAQRFVGKWIMRAVLGAYFDGIGSAMHPGDKPVGLNELLETLKGLEDAGEACQ